MRLLIFGLFLFCALACGGSSSSSPPSSNVTDKERSNLAKNNEEVDVEDNVAMSADQILGRDASIVHAKYAITLRTAGVDACTGAVVIRVKAQAPPKTGDSSAGLFSIDDGIVKCPGVGTFDLKEMMGAFQDQSPPPDMSKAVDVTDHVIGLKALRDGRYDPPRPLLPSFLASEPDQLRTLDLKRSVTLTDTKTNTTATGEVQVKTLSLGEYKPEKMERTFPKVLHFQTTNTGFAEADKISNFIFDSMQFHISLAPLVILRIQFNGRASDYTGKLGELANKKNSDPGGAAAPSIDPAFEGVIAAIGRFVKVQVEIDLIDQKNLDEKNSTSQDAGPVIGLQ